MRSSPSSSVGQSRSPQASQRSSPSRIAHRHQVRSDQSILAARVVVAEGSEFVLEPLPVRTSPLPSASPTGQHRRISAPNPQSYSSRPPPFAPLPPISNSSAPPRARQVDRPYRPPPSSSARFYERQQQRWLLQHTDPPPNTLEKYSAPSSIPPLLASPPLSTSRPFSATTSLVHAHPASPSHCFLLDAEQHNLAARSRSGSNASPVLRSRANSVSSLAPPATTLRARSGSAGSFTRSRISNGYMSNDDDETVENQPLQLMSAVHQDANEQQARPRSASFLPTPSDHDPLPACKKQSPESTFVDTTLGDSGDADWDAELGISETDHAEPLRLPLLPSAEHVLQSSRIRMSDSILTAPTAVVASNITKDSSNPQSCLQSINAADLRGIRVTSAVSENWDDDFLFQIDQEPIDSEPHNSYTGQSQVASDHPNSERDSAERLLQSHADQMAASEDDVENWDDAFSWNAESIFTPSASTSSSLYDFMQRSDANDRLSLGNTTYAKSALSPELPQTFSRQADSAKGHVLTSQKNNLPTVSSMTYAAGISARLAAQSDGESHQARLLQDSADHSAPRYPESKQYSALSRDRGMRSKTRVVNCRTDDSGDETETEIPSKEALASALTRPARRSLGSALGFDVRRKSVAKDAAVGKASPVCVETQNKDNVDSTQAKSHTRSQSKSKVGALQRFSFSRSRLNVANVSSTSINEMQQAEESPQRPYVNDANKSQASLLSHASTSSSTSRHGSTPTSLERSYNMLRSTSFRRLLGRSEKNSGVAIPRTTVDQASTLRRGSDPFHPMLPVSSPPRDKVSAHAVNQVMSSTSVRNTFRRSIEVTPTRPKNQSGRRGSDGSQLDLLEQALFDRSSSSITSPTFVRRARQQSDASKPTNQQPCEGCNPPAARPSLPLDYSGIRPSPTSGLRRDLSSSNTLRAGLSFAPGNATKPSVAISARQWNASKDTYAPAHSDAASTDGSAALYPYNGEKTMRGPGGHSSASRSVSASTAHSHTSVESLYGYRMRKQISTSSGADAPDSETSYGTSNGSSPRFVRQRSSTSNCYADVGSAIDTKDTAWLASVDLSGQQESSKRHEIHHGRASSMPGSPLALENTLDGTPAVPLLRTTRKDLAPDTSLSPSQMTKQMQVVSVPPGVLDATYQQAPPSTTDPGVFLAKELSMDTSAPSLASSSQAMAPSAASISSRRTAARRNSLGDLKIPSRISKAQTGIRNNMNLVRDFAKGIEELKVLKASYMDYKMNTPRITSNAGESVQNWLECADVLIGLGEGRSESDATARVDTLTHTPLSEHVDGRCITFSDASANVGPTSPLDHLANRQMLTSGTRSTSGMSQRTTSTMDSGRSVDVHREIDILSVILGGQMLTAASHSGSRSHARYQAEAYTREDLPRQNNTYPVPSSQGHSIASMADESKLATPNGETFGGKRNSADDRASTSERPVKTAPGLSSSSNPSLGDVSELNRDDVGDVNRSAKRRLRSASRAGLQGLRELLKVFKGTPVEDSGAAMSKGSGLTEIEPARDDAKDQPRYSIDGGPLTPTTSRPKRKSITLKRRSFLRSKTSLESVSAKAADMQVPPEATPPLPLSADVGWYSQPSASQKDKRKPEMSPAKSSLDMTWEAGSADRSTQGFEPRRPATASSKAVRRISFQSVLGGNGAKRQSKDVALVSEPSPKRSNTLQQHVTQVKSTQHERSHSVVQHGSSLQHARPSLVTGTCEVSRIASLDPRRVSTSVDTLHRQDQLQLQLASPAGASRTAQVRAHSSTEGTAPQPPMIQKLALRPEAMPGLLVYVMATKQHLQAAIDEMAPSSRRDVLL